MNTENPLMIIWVYFCKCCFKLLFSYATTSRALVQIADDDVKHFIRRTHFFQHFRLRLSVGNVTAIKKHSIILHSL